ncbi:MAG: phosphopantetheine-binding protein [Malacoplasma sp.]
MELINKINNIIAKKGFKFKITNENLNKPFKDFDIDSISLMTIILEIENAFSIQLPDDELIKIKTVNDLLKILKTVKN